MGGRYGTTGKQDDAGADYVEGCGCVSMGWRWDVVRVCVWRIDETGQNGEQDGEQD